MHTDSAGWNGEGSFTTVLLAALETVGGLEAIKVEDAPSSRAEAGYAFISNEVYVTFSRIMRRDTVRRFGISWPTTVEVDALTIEGLGEALGSVDGVGSPDYADDGMLQYLRTETIVAPYQTKGFKIVEMVRIYRASLRSAAEP